MELLGFAALIYVLWQIIKWFAEPEDEPEFKVVEHCMACGCKFSSGPCKIHKDEMLICKLCSKKLKSNA